MFLLVYGIDVIICKKFILNIFAAFRATFLEIVSILRKIKYLKNSWCRKRGVPFKKNYSFEAPYIHFHRTKYFVQSMKQNFYNHNTILEFARSIYAWKVVQINWSYVVWSSKRTILMGCLKVIWFFNRFYGQNVLKDNEVYRRFPLQRYLINNILNFIPRF